MPGQSPIRYRFAEFELDGEARVLRRNGLRLKLQPKPLEILTAMLERPGVLITREELRRRLWADGTFVDFDQGLNVAVKKLRAALCDSADEPRYIETVPGLGYRWIAKIEAVPPASSSLPTSTNGGTRPEATATASAAPGPFSNSRATATGPAATPAIAPQLPALHASRREVHWLVLGVAVAAIIIAATFVARRVSAGRIQPVRAVLALPGDMQVLTTGDNAGLALSPDGRTLAFSAVSADGQSRLWTRGLDSLRAQELAGTEQGAFPFWSPDGRQIAFFTAAQLKRVDLATGKVATICKADSGRGGAWLSNNELLFTRGTTDGIYRISGDGSNLQAVTNVQAPYTTHRWPEVLADGKHFIFLAASHSNDSEPAAIMLGSLDGAPPKLLVHTGSAAKVVGNVLLYVSGGKLMYQQLGSDGSFDSAARVVADDVEFDSGTWYGSFTASQNVLIYWARPQVPARQVISWYDSRGRKLADASPPGNYRNISLSPNGMLIAATCGDPDVNICVIHKDGSVTHLTDQPISDYPVWSPDSSTLAYQTHRGSGNLGFAFERLSGSGAEAVFKSDVNPLAWHPDGKHLLMVGDDRASIFDVNGREQRKFPVNASVSYNAQFSPDGKWLAYVSDETGKPEVYAASFPSGEGVVQISKGGGMAPHWRRDGRELYYLGPAKTIFAVGTDVNHGIVKLSSSRPLFSVPSIPVQWAAFSFDVAADGEKFLVNTNLPGSRSDLVLITNWSR